MSGMGRTSSRWTGNGAELAHVLHHSLHIFDRCGGYYAVPQVEDVPGTAAGLDEYLAHACAKQIFAGKERDGIKIALHGDPVAEGGPALVQGHPPIEADHVSAGLAHCRQKGRGVHTEVNDRHSQLLHFAH
jgi:hypothetical protein